LSDESRDARPEAEAITGRDRGEVGQHAVINGEGLDRARILRLPRPRIVAACHQQHDAVRGRREHLMGVDPGVEFVRLRNRRADRSVGVQPMHSDVAGIVVGGEQILPCGVDTHVDRARRQRRWNAEQAKRTSGRIDGQHIRIVLVAGDARSAIA
jgi:hypothetical protein